METRILISAKEAARRLGISRANLSRLVTRGRIGVYRIGGKTMFSGEILEDFKASVFNPIRAAAR